MLNFVVLKNLEKMKARIYTNVAVATNKRGEHTVNLIIDRGGKRMKLSTGMKSKQHFTGREFPPTEKSHRMKTTALNRLLVDVEDICTKNDTATNDEVLELVTERITGMPREKNLPTLVSLLRDYAEGKKQQTAAIYRTTADRVEEYDPDADTDITPAWLEDFERYMRHSRGMMQNSIAIHMRNIRTVMNKARRDGITQNYPFINYKVREERKVEVGDLTVEELRQLRDYKVEPWQEIHRDLFMLSFYLAGVNIGDLLLCKGLTHGRFVCRRQKTGQPVDLPVCPEAMAIINKYRGKNYLLNVLDTYSNYRDFIGHINRALKKIGTSEIVPDKLGRMRKVVYHPLFPDITTYTARYTFASIAANELDIPEDQIGRCMGHAWTQHVTSRYISRNRKKTDEVVAKVVNFVSEK